MALVEPITSKKHVKKAGQYIKDNFDAAYSLIWQIGIDSGYRITDITEIKYSDINYKTGIVTLAENKGTKANKARARLRVLEDVKNELIALYSGEPAKMMSVFVTKAKDVYKLVPDAMLALVDIRINQAIEKAPAKYRTAKLSKSTLTRIKARQDKYSLIDEGYLFARATLASNRARNAGGVISRQACYKVFSQLTAYMETLGESVKVGCHSLRKIFARHLYESSDNNIAMLMRLLGHSSVEMSLRYIGINNNEEIHAIDKMFMYMDA